MGCASSGAAISSTPSAPDDVMWTANGSAVSMDLPDTIFAGLAVTSHADGTLCDAAFNNVTIEPIFTSPAITLAAPWIGADLGDARAQGRADRRDVVHGRDQRHAFQRRDGPADRPDRTGQRQFLSRPRGNAVHSAPP